jgi:hypothetical protein
MEHSESVDSHPGGEFEMDTTMDRPGAVAADPYPGPGDAFEMDAKMPNRYFEKSESMDQQPDDVRKDDFALATTQEPSISPTTKPPSTLVPTTLLPTTLLPTTLLPTTLMPTTWKPTSPPTELPTKLPTGVPTKLPTTRPTLLPTTRPTLHPTTKKPSFNPTTRPTTEKPTEAPSMMPSATTRVATLFMIIEDEVPLTHDYHIPLGAYNFTVPEKLIDELIKTLRRAGDLMEALFGPYNSEFKLDEFLYALNISYDWDVNIDENSALERNGNRDLMQMQEMISNVDPGLSPNAKVMNLGGERAAPEKLGRIEYAMAHMGLLLGQAFQESMITGMCDEQNKNPTDKVNPGCGQDGANYRFPDADSQLGQGNFSCFANEYEWMNGFKQVSGEIDPNKDKEFVGCPLQPPVDSITSRIMPSNHEKNEYQEMPMECGLEANIGSRGCCWWGRGMLQMTYQCNYGDFQKNWGTHYQVPDREDINICMNPGQVCSDEFREMKYLTGLYTWIKQVVHNPYFDFNQELEEWVESGMDMSPGGFIERVGGALVNGDPNIAPPNAEERRLYTKAAVEAIMPIQPFGVEQYFHYGNVARCKPAVQSSIFNSTVNHTAGAALKGDRSATRIAETDCDPNPFWQVDLGRSYQIISVHVVWYDRYHYEMMDLPEYNATKTVEITKTNVELQIDLLNENGENVADVERSQLKHSIEANGKIESVWTFQVENSTDLKASQVRVSLASAESECKYISLAEVLVMSVCELGDACLTKSTCEEQNLAQCKPTSQSSTEGDLVPDFAVDGSKEAVATTLCEEAPSFMIDLMGKYNVTAVALINHADAGGNALERLNGVVVELLDANENVVAEDSHKPRLMGDEMGDVYVMKFDDVPAIAHKVRVSLAHAAGNCEALKLAEVAVMGTCLDDSEHCKTWENCKHTNVGRCMPATQSSIFDGGIAARAVDGHTSLAHTMCEEKPWWGVNLLGSHPVTEVVIHNRHDCCFERLNSVEVSLLDDAGNILSTVKHDPVTDGVIEESWAAIFAETDDAAIAAAKVRISTTHEGGTCEPLNLAEVQVMSPCADSSCLTWADCDNGNVAQCKPAEQSSTIYGDVAANAVNGHESLAHTDCELNPWWEVDLLSTRVIQGVVIHNREDCCWERLNGVLVQLVDASNATVGSITHDPATMGEIKTMWVATFNDVTANKVRVSVQNPEEGQCSFLNLAEVEVRSQCLEGDACLTGYGCDHGNVAKCKPARQSSTLPAQDRLTVYQGVAGDAVDGTESLAHTACEQNPWWEVNLFYRREVSEVVIHNREDCCLERLNGVIVDLLDKEHNVIARAQHNPATEGVINTMWAAKFPPMSMAWFVRVMVEHPAGTCDYLNLAEVEVISVCEEGDACMNPELECPQGNVAQCKPARQISTVEGSVARFAVDGERDHSRTDCEERPWWEVDLLGSYHVSEVVIFSRKDCCHEELNNVIVELVSFTGETVKMVQHDPVTDGMINASWTAKFDAFGDVANKVRVSLFNEVGNCKFLDLGDVQVMSTCLDTDACYYGATCGDGNVAQCKPATQSSTREGMVADKAVDGEESLSMTQCEEHPWWTVDLTTDYPVKEVAVYNRRDCCFGQLNGTIVELLDANGAVIDTAQHDPETMGEIRDVWLARFDPVTVTRAVRAVRVSVKHEGGQCGFLELAEVQVLSACLETDACKTGFDCEHSWVEAT